MGKARPLEADAQATILDLAHWRRWETFHVFDSRRSRAGFPDVVLWRDRVVYAEIKRPGQKPRRDQVEVLDALARAGAEVYLWTLDDLYEVDRVLTARSWRFVPAGLSSPLSGVELEGPRLMDDDAHVSFAPRSAWIPGIGRRE